MTKYIILQNNLHAFTGFADWHPAAVHWTSGTGLLTHVCCDRNTGRDLPEGGRLLAHSRECMKRVMHCYQSLVYRCVCARSKTYRYETY